MKELHSSQVILIMQRVSSNHAITVLELFSVKFDRALWVTFVRGSLAVAEIIVLVSLYVSGTMENSEASITRVRLLSSLSTEEHINS